MILLRPILSAIFSETAAPIMAPTITEITKKNRKKEIKGAVRIEYMSLGKGKGKGNGKGNGKGKGERGKEGERGKGKREMMRESKN